MSNFWQNFRKVIKFVTQSPAMDSEELDPIDILAYTTEELQCRFQNVSDPADYDCLFDDFLQKWSTDTTLNTLKDMKIEFEKDLDWFNVSQPLSMESLRGKLIVLDFFTYCCINCMHVLPELRALEELYPVEKGLVVVGVHSPKFQNEKDTANILSAALRYNISHPIVNDPRSTLWRALGIRCWPSLLLVSPNGIPLLLLMGEGHKTFLKSFIGRTLRFFERKGEISKFEIPRPLLANPIAASNIRFPAKIARGNCRYALADAGNNRVLVFNSDGVVDHRIGGCASGFVDGDFAVARFNSPQGVDFLDDDKLIVADTENHALRQITLSTRTVETLAGTGQQGVDRVGGEIGPLQAISSPWDVVVFHTRDMDMSFHLDEQNIPEKPIILVAMAGTHQIWGYFPEGIIWWKFRKFEPRSCVSIIGNGLEENRNNSYPQNAAFAQPSGLAMAKHYLFIADSESSSIRKVSMVDGKVTAVVGGDRNPLNLFAFGDADGKQYNAKLQHPLAVTYNHVSDKVYVADTYNHKIKVIDTATNSIETLVVKDESGALQKFNEPAGLCFDPSGQFLLVADTNAHNIQIVDMQTLKTRRFKLDFSQAVQATETDSPLSVRSGVQLLKHLPLRACKQLKLRVSISLEENLKYTEQAPQKWNVASLNSALLNVNASSGQVKDGKFLLLLERVEPAAKAALEDIKLDIVLSICDSKSCLMKRFSLILNDDTSGSPSGVVDGVAEERVNIHITRAAIKLN